MDVLLGLSTAAATSLLLSFAYGAHRRPSPAKWTTLPGLSMLVCVAMTLMAPVALGFFIKAALAPVQEFATLSMPMIVVTIALVVAAVIFSPVLIRPAKRKAAVTDQPAADNRNSAPAQETGIAA